MADQGDIAVEANNLTKRYGKTIALAGLSLSIPSDEFCCIIGPNGAGKTTFLLLLATVLRPTSGRLMVLGHDVSTQGDLIRSRVGIAFQEPKLFWRHTVQEIVDFHIAMCGLGREGRQRAAQVLDALELAPLRHRRALELSGGQQKRLELARVLIQRPALAIFDEPTAGIDIVGKHTVWAEMKRLKEEGSTIIFATNDIYEGEQLGERIAILDSGNLIAWGDLPTLRRALPLAEVADFTIGDEAISRALALLAGVDGVLDVKPLGKTAFRAYVADGHTCVPRILERLLQEKVSVSGLKMTAPSLDDVFLQLTGRSMPR